MARYGVANSRERIPTPAPPTAGRSMARIWPFVLTVGFGIVFMALGDLAWLTSIRSDSPVYTSATSAQMYTATLTTATIATLILASFATSCLGHLELRIPDDGTQESEAPDAE